MATGPYLSIMTLNVNGLNAPTKRQRLTEWIQKQDLYMLSTRDPSQNKRHIQSKSEGLEKIFHTMENKRKQETQYSYQIKYTFK